jgi:hypothetical protein
MELLMNALAIAGEDVVPYNAGELVQINTAVNDLFDVMNTVNEIHSEVDVYENTRYNILKYKMLAHYLLKNYGLAGVAVDALYQVASEVHLPEVTVWQCRIDNEGALNEGAVSFIEYEENVMACENAYLLSVEGEQEPGGGASAPAYRGTAASGNLSNQPHKDRITLMPNPANAAITVNLELNPGANVKVMVLNTLGQQVIPLKEIGNAGADRFSFGLNIESLSPDIYTIVFLTGQGVLSRHFVKTATP